MNPRNNSPVVKLKPTVAAVKKPPLFDWGTLLTGISRGRSDLEYGVQRNIFMQGQAADSVFFLLRGKVQLSVTSSEGKEAIVATLGSGEFFGEGCLAGQPLRMATATSVEDCTLSRVEKATMVRMLHEQPGVAEIFVTHLLDRNIRYEADLVDQLFNSSEKRLARILLLLSHFTEQSQTETVAAGINQENLAQMVGTTRSRISHFMNGFRKRGFIEYESGSVLTVQRGLLSVVQQD
ncbi:MAG: Crp/Fnr family transcriptional regulator [Acidobacteriota bacterium]|nr:Crp/Fnr family transcriptional regulator [Acidobacteriota bacterium]